MKKTFKAIVAAGMLLSSTPLFAAKAADIAFVIDQTGSMGSVWSWVSNSITAISQGMVDAGITARYAVGGYESDFGLDDSRNVYQDFTSDITDITNITSGVSLYGSRENSYDAAVDATTGFSWDNSVAKVIILIQDERVPQSDVNTEASVDATMNSGSFLLNVVTYQSNYSAWDEAVFRTSTYTGLFDLSLLQSDPDAFTTALIGAKVQEIINHPTVPVPAAVWLFGSGLVGLIGFGRRKMAAA